MRLFALPSSLRAALAVLALAGCVEPYAPNVVDANTNYLVVDGFIKGNGRTRVKLSRSVNLSTAAAAPAERGATLFIVDNAGTRYALTEIASGSYQSDSLLLNTAQTYQLRLTTSTGTAYESALVPLKVTPPIDQISFRRDNEAVHLLLSTHDAQQQSRYYRWGFTETWEFHSAYFSVLEYYPSTQTLGSRQTPIYTCWRTEQPSTIRQGSTAQLSQDALTNFEVLNLSAKSERFVLRYSVLVSQYVETPQEFTYYELLRKNTEAVGSVNDPLPTQLTGNVRRVDGTAEPVLGFVSAHTVQQKRFFIDNQDLALPAGWVFDSAYPTCTLGIELFNPPPPGTPIAYPYTRVYNTPDHIPVDFYYDPPGSGTRLGYVGSTRECVDCRARGNITKPAFW